MNTVALGRVVAVVAAGLMTVGCVSIGPSASGSALPSSTGPSLEPTSKPRPSANPTKAPTNRPTASATAEPTATASTEPTPTASTEATPAPTLSLSLAAVYGSSALSAGFEPDPFTVGVTSGGPTNATSAGIGCYGFTSAAPTFSVNYTSGTTTLLRFYFIGTGDTTMIVNSPAATYSCVDDSFGTTNPTVDFSTPSGGRYDIWVASYNSADAINGTLYVTEISTNHP